MNPVFWKLSMGPGSSGEDFKNLLSVLDWVRQGVVLVHKDTSSSARSRSAPGTCRPGPQGYEGQGHIEDNPGRALYGSWPAWRVFLLVPWQRGASDPAPWPIQRPGQPVLRQGRRMGRAAISMDQDFCLNQAVQGRAETA